jgi:hypothetical protein
MRQFFDDTLPVWYHLITQVWPIFKIPNLPPSNRHFERTVKQLFCPIFTCVCCGGLLQVGCRLECHAMAQLWSPNNVVGGLLAVIVPVYGQSKNGASFPGFPARFICLIYLLVHAHTLTPDRGSRTTGWVVCLWLANRPRHEARGEEWALVSRPPSHFFIGIPWVRKAYSRTLTWLWRRSLLVVHQLCDFSNTNLLLSRETGVILQWEAETRFSDRAWCPKLLVVSTFNKKLRDVTSQADLKFDNKLA